MAFYYVNNKAQDNGDHEVHKSTCTYLPIEDNRLYFGIYDNCTSAVKEAKKHYTQSNGCYYCSNACHTS
ncbi:hypothetical protein FW758_21495 [Shewanella sp. 1180_01]